MGSKVAKEIAPCLEQSTHKNKTKKTWALSTFTYTTSKSRWSLSIHQINKATQIEVGLKDKSAWSKSTSSKQKHNQRGEVWSVKQKENFIDEKKLGFKVW
jgi:hypothetical protein